MTEMEIPWRLVVESDEIYSAKTDKWYEVVRTAKHGRNVKIQAKGMPVPIVKDVADNRPVRVRRGPTGKAVDVFVEIFSSGEA